MRASADEEVGFGDVVRLDPDERGGELDAGRWRPMTRNTWRHGRIVANLTGLCSCGRARGTFTVAAGDPGTKLASDPDVLRGPDIGVIRREREPVGQGEAGWLDGGPDVAVEVVGDAQSIAETMNKGLQYLAAGAGIVWIVDAQARRVVVLQPPDHVSTLSEADTLVAESVLPGFRCRVAGLFE